VAQVYQKLLKFLEVMEHGLNLLVVQQFEYNSVVAVAEAAVIKNLEEQGDIQKKLLM
jgi:hypothetical protein